MEIDPNNWKSVRTNGNWSEQMEIDPNNWKSVRTNGNRSEQMEIGPYNTIIGLPLPLFLCTLALLHCVKMPACRTTSSWNGVARIEVPAIVAIGAVVASSLATLFLISASAKKRVRNGGAGCDDELL